MSGGEFMSGESFPPRSQNILTLRRLRGGVKIRASEFLGGGVSPQQFTFFGIGKIQIRRFGLRMLATPQNRRWRFYPSPQAAGGEKNFR